MTSRAWLLVLVSLMVRTGYDFPLCRSLFDMGFQLVMGTIIGCCGFRGVMTKCGYDFREIASH